MTDDRPADAADLNDAESVVRWAPISHAEEIADRLQALAAIRPAEERLIATAVKRLALMESEDRSAEANRAYIDACEEHLDAVRGYDSSLREVEG